MIASPLPVLLAVASIAAGLLLIFLGRRLVWLFAGTVGYLFGAEAGFRAAGPGDHWLVWTVALAFGVMGVLATVAQPRAAGLFACALAGGVLLLRGAAEFPLTLPSVVGLFLFGALVSSLLTALWFDEGIIVLSVLIGSLLTLGVLPLGGVVVPVAWAFLIFTGVAIQWVGVEADGRGSIRRQLPKSVHVVGILSK